MKKLFGILCLLALVAAMSFASGGKEAAAKQEPVALDILSHRIHKIIATEEAGGDIITPWVAANPNVSGVNWNPLEIKPLHDRLFRESTTPSTDIDIGYITNFNATPRVPGLFEPLDEYLKNDPIDGFEENFSKGMLAAVTFGGKLYAIPVRSATHGLGWNKQIFALRGLDRPPKTPDEFLDFAKKLTFTRDDGVKVYGYVQHSHYYYTSVNSIARMKDGGFITSDLKVVCDQPATIWAVGVLRNFYENGIVPKQITSWQHAEKQRAMQLGQAAMTWDVMGKIHSYNKPDQTEWGSWTAAPYPLDPSLKSKYEVGPANTEFWCMVIPKNAQHKDVSWQFIKYLSSHKSQLAMALNGNGPTRASVFADPVYKEKVPYAEILEKAQAVARVPLPGFDKSPQAAEMMDNYIERAMLGDMSPEAAMKELAKKLKELSSQLK